MNNDIITNIPIIILTQSSIKLNEKNFQFICEEHFRINCNVFENNFPLKP